MTKVTVGQKEMDIYDPMFGSLAFPLIPLEVATFEEAIAKGGYDIVDASLHGRFEYVDGDAVAMAHLLRFDEMVEAKKFPAVHRLRQGTITDLSKLGAWHGEAQRRFPIVALGSPTLVGANPGVESVPYLTNAPRPRGKENARLLMLTARNFHWSPAFRFLMVET